MREKSFDEVKVSVILPSLNVADYIQECMESVLSQSLQEIEIICVDAGSTDGTCEILEKYANEDNRVKLIHSPKRSYGLQVNMGIGIAVGEYVAIVETDDYIEPDMYRTLYHVAKEKRADYAKADFDDFFFLKDGQKLFLKVHLMRGHVELYGKIINAGQHLFLFRQDYNIWSGIYRKGFLTEKRIRLNETAGAAFQDIGFMQQVLCFAERCVYLDNSFYRYRIDRDASSSFSPRGLVYAYQEYRWLFEVSGIREKIDSKRLKGIYQRMVQVVLHECSKQMQMKNEKYITEEFSNELSWLLRELREGIEKGVLRKEYFEEIVWNELQIILSDERAYFCHKAGEYRVRKTATENLIRAVKDNPVIIFGCGTYGVEAYKLFSDSDIHVVSFCDNDPEKWERYIGNTVIRSLEQCTGIDPSVYYVIANKYNRNEIREQLKKVGISAEKILDFE